MSYRNDYDAARARLEVLETEHAKLLAENRRLRGSTHPEVRTVNEPALGGATLATVCVIGSLALAFIAFAIAGT